MKKINIQILQKLLVNRIECLSLDLLKKKTPWPIVGAALSGDQQVCIFWLKIPIKNHLWSKHDNLKLCFAFVLSFIAF